MPTWSPSGRSCTARVEAPRSSGSAQKDPSKLSRRRLGRACARSSATSGCSASTTTPAATSPTATATTSPPRCSRPTPTPSTARTGLLDYDAIEQQAQRGQARSSCSPATAPIPRKINFRRMREIADAVGAVFMVDMAHFAGLVAGKGLQRRLQTPSPHAHVVTSTTHKTLRGPRGGLVLCNEEFARPGGQGLPAGDRRSAAARDGRQGRRLHRGEPPRVPALRASASWRTARALAAACIAEGMTVATGGTDNHLLLIDVRPELRPHGPPGREPPARGAASRSTATPCPSIRTAPGTPAACASARRPSPRSAWASRR